MVINLNHLALCRLEEENYAGKITPQQSFHRWFMASTKEGEELAIVAFLKTLSDGFVPKK